MARINKLVSDVKLLYRGQYEDGRWHHNEYMCGLLNGIEICLSVLEERDPTFHELDEWAELRERKEEE